MRYRRLYYGRKTVIFRAVCLALVLLIAVLLADAQLRPAVTELAALEAHRLATERINAAVVSVLSQGAPEYSELVKVSYGADNSITGVSTDAVKLNLFKARVTEAIDAAFEDKGAHRGQSAARHGHGRVAFLRDRPSNQGQGRLLGFYCVGF